MPAHIAPRTTLTAQSNALRLAGKTIVFTNGCFDLLHVGHIRYLQKAKALGDILIIGLNSDSSVRQIKGDLRPITPEKERAELLSVLEMVDYITIFDEPDPYQTIVALQPDILVKGADWDPDKIIGRDIVEQAGGRVALIRENKGFSSSNIIETICNRYATKSSGNSR